MTVTKLDLDDPRTDEEMGTERRHRDNRRHGYSNDPEPGFKRHFTVQNALMLLLLLFQAGQYWERSQNTSMNLGDKVKALETRVLAVELAASASATSDQQIFVRRDVIEARLLAMESQLADIKYTLQIRNPAVRR